MPPPPQFSSLTRIVWQYRYPSKLQVSPSPPHTHTLFWEKDMRTGIQNTGEFTSRSG